MGNRKGGVLYVGQAYYNAWYLSRELRKLGWKADVLNFDPNREHQIYYHGEDIKFNFGKRSDKIEHFRFFLKAFITYDIFHFSNAYGLYFINDFDDSIRKDHHSIAYRVFKGLLNFLLGTVCRWNEYKVYRLVKFIGFKHVVILIQKHIRFLPDRWDIKLLKKFGKKIVYSNNGCLDGVSQSSFRTWSPEPVCDLCKWKNVSIVCSDKRNLEWGKLRNSLADYQILIGGNRKDYNVDPRIHEVPEFYCLDHNYWVPDLVIPSNYLLPFSIDVIKIYHSVGNFESRTDLKENMNIKCTHIYIPLIERLKREGYNVEMIFFHDVPNKKIRYYMVQADIVVDMLTFGFFGANVREAMMMGKPAICYLRQSWLESMRKEIPEYVDELPVISATPQTIYYVLKDLIENKEKRIEIGRRSREFAVKWHSSEAGAKRLSGIYSNLMLES